MDEIVRQAMAKWPEVPAVFGWLGLDRRGRWLIRDEHIGNPLLTGYIGRNYARDDDGCWFFQNGPQRVFVRLAYAPWVLRVGDAGTLVTHTQLPVHDLKGGWIDEEGIVLLETEHGLGLVDDRDVEALALRFTDAAGNALDEDALLAALERMQAGVPAAMVLPWRTRAVALHPIARTEVPARFGFVADPLPPEGAAVGA